MPATLTTRVFLNGNSQAVRIPREFRLDAKQVEISRNDDGDLVLRPVPTATQGRGAALLEALGSFDDAFVAALEKDRFDQPPAQDRDDL